MLFIRPGDLPAAEEPSPALHLEEHKATIYENLRDLNFEYRLGKLSDADYEKSKLSLQNELAGVLAEIDRVLKVAPPPGVSSAAKPAADALKCPHCGAKFERALKFCGECGKSMTEAQA